MRISSPSRDLTTTTRIVCRAALALALLGIAGPSTARGEEPATDQRTLPANVTFNRDIRPIFKSRCVGCHGGVQQASGLSFITRGEAMNESDSGAAAIVPGDADGSALMERVSTTDLDLRMPPADHGPALTAREIALLRRWIEQGAVWEDPWAYCPPQDTELPAVQRPEWVRRPLDHYILARLEEASIEPAAEAPRAEWLRRVTFDLTGLPPSAEDYREFETDRSEEAYEHVVDRLLASPRYGERWASMWLDLARYADTTGYERDPPRSIWPYRDWLIRALNRDIPYDQFTILQLAGDRLPDAQLSDVLATAFHRNTQTNREDGTDDEEFRIAAVLDRVNTTWQVWQGITFGCTQCHSHPYDPVSHEEYYRFAAIFNTTRDEDVVEDLPKLAVPNDAAEWDAARQLDRRIAELQAALHFLQRRAERDAGWALLSVDRAEASSDRIEVDVRAHDGTPASEIWTSGTIPNRSTLTVECALSPSMEKISAVRLEGLPRDEAAALKLPEPGFVLSRLRLCLVLPDGRESPVELTDAFCDEPHPELAPIDSLNDSPNGWASYPHLATRRWGIFLPQEPIRAPAGSRLRLTMTFEKTAKAPLCFRRLRLSASSSSRWPSLIQSPAYRQNQVELAATTTKRRAIASTAVPIMRELAAPFQRATYMFVRGNWMDKGERVRAGVPAVFPQPPEEDHVDRLAMARWLVSGENPLTARVMVNRVWAELFGVGIVETLDDFGSSGSLPSHPELLDHLALRFQGGHAWSVKALLREVALSATYRQSSASTPHKNRHDPHNRLLSHGPRTRLTAEMVRDQALALSGLLSAKMYGMPVMPPQPEGIWQTVYSREAWVAARGEDRFRRAIYTYWRRTSGYPSLLAFDMPSRETCVGRRIPTNTPLQALVTLNDEAYVEMAAAFAERMLHGSSTPATQIAFGYSIATGRQPTPEALAALLRLYEEISDNSESAPRNREQADKGIAAELPALSAVASVILNLDEVLTK